MPKKEKSLKKSLASQVMATIEEEKITIKPKWVYVLGSLISIISITASFIVLIYSSAIISFFFREHGPFGAYRLQQLIGDFPWWAIALAVSGFFLAYKLFQKFDISYKQNAKLIIAFTALSAIIAGMVVDSLHFTEQIHPRRFYMKQNSEFIVPDRPKNNRLNERPKYHKYWLN